MRVLSRFGIAIVAALLCVSAAGAEPDPSKDIMVLANQWLGMSMDDFKKAVGVTASASEIKNTLSGKPVTELADTSAPGLSDLEPGELNVFGYTFDASGHLIEMGGFLWQGVTEDDAAKAVTAKYGPPIEGNVTLGMKEHLWAVNGVALELSAGTVFIYRLPQHCVDAFKAATPDPKALEGCGRP
ncbi:MAG TPA: hypothetical protein VGH91_05205 [Gammaproteobacteria bacterium]|jgi:hypothetical protein